MAIQLNLVIADVEVVTYDTLQLGDIFVNPDGNDVCVVTRKTAKTVFCCDFFLQEEDGRYRYNARVRGAEYRLKKKFAPTRRVGVDYKNEDRFCVGWGNEDGTGYRYSIGCIRMVCSTCGKSRTGCKYACCPDCYKVCDGCFKLKLDCTC